MKLAYINFLWIVFTLLGAIIFGFFPAYTAMLTIVRKWIIGEADIPVFKTFFTVYKKEFFKSNCIGLFLLLLGYILYVDISIVMEANSIINLITFPLVIIIIGFFLASCYTFPIIVHYETKIGQALKKFVYYNGVVTIFNDHDDNWSNCYLLPNDCNSRITSFFRCKHTCVYRYVVGVTCFF